MALFWGRNLLRVNGLRVRARVKALVIVCVIARGYYLWSRCQNDEVFSIPTPLYRG